MPSAYNPVHHTVSAGGEFAASTATRTVPPIPAVPAAVRVRRALPAVALIAGALMIAALLVIVPWGERNELGYQSVAPVRDALWTGLLLDALAMVGVGIGLACVASALVRRRGAALATAGGVLTSLGGVAFGLGAFAYAALAWYATDLAVIDPAQGASLLSAVEADPGHALVVQQAGFLMFTLGSILLAVALLRARTVPRWLPVAYLVLTVVPFTVDGRTLDLAQAALMLVLAAIGVVSLRSGEPDRP